MALHRPDGWHLGLDWRVGAESSERVPSCRVLRVDSLVYRVLPREVLRRR